MSENGFDTLSFLLTVDLFHGLEQSTLAIIADKLTRVNLGEGEHLVRQDERDASLYIIVSGRLQIYYKNSTDEAIDLIVLGARQTVGINAVLTGKRRNASAVALDEVVTLKLEREDFYELEEKSPDCYQKLLELLITNLRNIQLFNVLVEHELFHKLEKATLRELSNEMEWVTLTSGQLLFRQGDDSDAIYIVIAGRLRITVGQPDGSELFMRELLEGESLGEITFFVDQKRTANVTAVRDSELVRLPHDKFRAFAQQHPTDAITDKLVVTLINRFVLGREKNRNNTLATIAVVPLDGQEVTNLFCQRLGDSLNQFGPALHLNNQKCDQLMDVPGIAQTEISHHNNVYVVHWLGEQEPEHDYLIYEADMAVTPWTRRCLRQADHILLIANATSDPNLTQVEQFIEESRNSYIDTEISLVLLHPDKSNLPFGTHKWLKERKLKMHHHVSQHDNSDTDRVARILTGRAIGVVLGGGAARGMAHIGAIKGILDAGLSIDLIGGNSSGGLMAAQHAFGFDFDRMVTLSKTIKPSALMEFTLPLVSLSSGRKLAQAVKAICGDTQIEDLWIPYFCVTSNLTQAKLAVHRSGPLWKYVLATTNLPGLQPPVIDNGDLHVDGGLLNNLPVEVMSDLIEGGTVIAIDVSPSVDLTDNLPYGEYLSGWQILWSRLNPFSKKVYQLPGLATLLQRATVVSGVQTVESQVERGLAELYIRLPLDNYKASDFHAFDEMVEIGYQATRERVTAWKVSKDNQP